MNKNSQVTVENNCECPEKRNLKNEISFLEGELEICVNQKRVLEGQNCTLLEAIADLKGNMTELAFEDLQSNYSTFGAEIVTAYQKRLKRSSNYTKEKYSDEMRKFAITMHGYSPKSYRLV